MGRGMATMTAIPVTLVTKDATHDDLTDAAYSEIFAELRQAHSLAQLCQLLRSQFSRALWNKYERGEAPLSRQMRSELRVAVGLPPLPPTLEEVAATVNPDALVVKVGEEAPHSVVLVGTSKTALICVNGTIWAKDTTEATEASVTKVTRSQRRRYVRPTATEAQEARRLAVRASWWAVIEAGLTALEG